MKRLATLLVLLAALSPARAATPLSILYTTAPSFLGAYVGFDQGIFARHGLEVKLTASAVSGNIPTALVGGSAQIGGIQTILLIQANDGGLDLVTVAGTEPYPAPYMQGLLAREGSGIKTLQDMPGHTMGSPGIGATMDILARELMIRAGVDDSKVARVEVPLPQMADALRNGSVDSVVSVDPSYSRAVEAGARPVADWNSLIPRGTFLSLYATTRDWAQANPQTLAAFRASLQEAYAFIAKPENEAAVRESFTRWTHLPANVVAATKLPHGLTVAVTPESLQFWAEVAKDQKLTQNPVDVKSLIAP